MPIKNTELKKIIDNITDEQDTLEISMPAESIKIDESDVQELCAVIVNQENIKEVRFGRAMISINSAQRIFATFIGSPYLSDLTMPLWSVVDSAGQGPLMDLQKHFTEALDAYNNPPLLQADEERDPKMPSKRVRMSAPTGISKKRYTP